MGKKKTKTTVDPSAAYKPYIDASAGNLQSAYTASQPVTNQVQTGLGNLFGTYSNKVAANDVTAAPGYNTLSRYSNGDFAGDTTSRFASGDFGSNPLTGFASGSFGASPVAGYARGDFGSSPLTNMASGNFGGNYLSNVAAGNYGDTALTGFANGNFGDNALTRAASGSMVGNNADFNTALQSSLDDVQRRINAQFGGSGAVNQTSHLDLLARDLGNTAATARAAQYNTDAQRAIDAENSLLGYQTGAANTLFGARTAAAGSLLGQQADAAKTMFGAQTAAGNNLLSAQSDAAKSLLSAQASAGERNRADTLSGLQLWPSYNASNYTGLGDVLSLANSYLGVPQSAALNDAGATSNLLGRYTNTNQTVSDPMGSVTGLLGAGASLYGAIYNPASLATKVSDKRVKNVQDLLGFNSDGLPVYNFTYKGDPAQTPQAGVMAQDVAQVRPDALGPTAPDGTMSVNYGALGMPDPAALGAATTPRTGIFGQKGRSAPQTIDVQPSAVTMSDQQAPGMPANDFAEAGGPGTPVPVNRGFFDRLIAPDPSTTAGRIGLLGQTLMASSGGAFGNLGKSLLSVRKSEQDQAKNAAETEETKAKTDYYRAQVGARGLPPSSPEERMMARYLDPATPAYERQALGLKLGVIKNPADRAPTVHVDDNGDTWAIDATTGSVKKIGHVGAKRDPQPPAGQVVTDPVTGTINLVDTRRGGMRPIGKVSPKPDNPSTADVVVPLLRKLQTGQRLTAGEQAALDAARPPSLDSMLFGGMRPAGGGLPAGPGVPSTMPPALPQAGRTLPTVGGGRMPMPATVQPRPTARPAAAAPRYAKTATGPGGQKLGLDPATNRWVPIAAGAR